MEKRPPKKGSLIETSIHPMKRMRFQEEGMVLQALNAHLRINIDLILTEISIEAILKRKNPL